MSLNPSNVRVVDPILSSYVRGYRQAMLVGGALFPRVPVSISGGQVLEFGKEGFKRYNARRAPGADTRRVEFGYLGKKFALVQDSLEAKVPREFLRDASQVPGIDLAKQAVNLVMNILLNGLEYDQASVALDANNYDANHKLALAGATKWSADTGKPLTDIANGVEAVRQTIGLRPNTAVLSAQAWKAAKNNPSVTERFKFTTNEPITLKQFASLIEVENVVVGDAVTADDAGTFSDIWGNNVVLAYVAPNASTIAEPSYGYTYTLEGHPLVEQPYWDNKAKSWIYGTTIERSPELTGMVAGYLIQNPN